MTYDYDPSNVMLQKAPRWAKKAMLGSVDSISEILGVGHLPKDVDSVLGCGHYGCVYPSRMDGIVVKLTTDPSEVELVRFILENDMQDDLEGMVRYHKMMDTGDLHRGRPVHLIWREEADFEKVFNWSNRESEDSIRMLDAFRKMSSFVKYMYDKYGHRPDFSKRVESSFDSSIGRPDYFYYNETNFWELFKKYGGILKKVWPKGIGELNRFVSSSDYMKIVPNPYLKYADRTADTLGVCLYMAEIMSSSPVMYLVGEVLLKMMCKGILLADVHHKNVGHVVREDHQDPILVITDPGHAVVLGFGVDNHLCQHGS